MCCEHPKREHYAPIWHNPNLYLADIAREIWSPCNDYVMETLFYFERGSQSAAQNLGGSNDDQSQERTKALVPEPIHFDFKGGLRHSGLNLSI